MQLQLVKANNHDSFFYLVVNSQLTVAQYIVTCLLPGEGSPTFSVGAGREFVREVTERPLITFKHLQSPVTDTRVKLHQLIISTSAYNLAVWEGGWKKAITVGKKHIKACLEFTLKCQSGPAKIWDKVLWSNGEKIKLIFLAKIRNTG